MSIIWLVNKMAVYDIAIDDKTLRPSLIKFRMFFWRLFPVSADSKWTRGIGPQCFGGDSETKK